MSQTFPNVPWGGKMLLRTSPVHTCVRAHTHARARARNTMPTSIERQARQGRNRGTKFPGIEPLQCAHRNLTGAETHTHSSSELLYICRTVTVLVKAACRLYLACAYRVLFSE